jgi:hypothetical protein
MVIGTAEANVCRMGELLKEMPKAAGSRGIGKKVEFSAGTPLDRHRRKPAWFGG